jgi:hypothetical protein
MVKLQINIAGILEPVNPAYSPQHFTNQYRDDSSIHLWICSDEKRRNQRDKALKAKRQEKMCRK